VLDQAAYVKEVDEDGGRSNEEVRKEGGIYLSKISRKQAVLPLHSSVYDLLDDCCICNAHLGYQLTFLEFAIHKSDISILVELCTA